MAPLEAMALGIPVIGGKDSGGVPYVLDGGKAGVLVDVKNPQAIADVLSSLWLNSAQRDEIARIGWDRARTTFSLEKMVGAYEAEYLKILSAN